MNRSFIWNFRSWMCSHFNYFLNHFCLFYNRSTFFNSSIFFVKNVRRSSYNLTFFTRINSFSSSYNFRIIFFFFSSNRNHFGSYFRFSTYFHYFLNHFCFIYNRFFCYCARKLIIVSWIFRSKINSSYNFSFFTRVNNFGRSSFFSFIFFIFSSNRNDFSSYFRFESNNPKFINWFFNRSSSIFSHFSSLFIKSISSSWNWFTIFTFNSQFPNSL